MPRTKKPPGQAVDRRNGRRTDLDVLAGQRFDPPGDLRPDALAAWDSYWSDAVATVQTSVDRALLLRWIGNTNRYLTLIEQADAEPVVSGSTGQPRPNPLYKLAYDIESSIRADERQLGIGPKNRADLGIAVIQERRSLAQMNAAYGGGDASGDQDEEDPRLQAIAGEAD